MLQAKINPVLPKLILVNVFITSIKSNQDTGFLCASLHPCLTQRGTCRNHRGQSPPFTSEIYKGYFPMVTGCLVGTRCPSLGWLLLVSFNTLCTQGVVHVPRVRDTNCSFSKHQRRQKIFQKFHGYLKKITKNFFIVIEKQNKHFASEKKQHPLNYLCSVSLGQISKHEEERKGRAREMVQSLKPRSKTGRLGSTILESWH